MMKSIFLSLLVSITSLAGTPDHFKDFADLASHEKEGIAYHVDVINRHASVTIIAIHGGKIEAGSAELAHEVAGTDLNLYAFIAALPKDNHRLHITSTHFDDPRALDLVKPSAFVISIHGFKETSVDRVCVGGGNTQRSTRLANDLKNSNLGFEIESPCTQFGGSGAQNIVNLGKEPGVQLELSTHLRDRLVVEPALMKNFAALIRAEALR